MATAGGASYELRQKLMELGQADDPYPFLTLVDDYLPAVPDDDQVRALAINALIGKGLVSVAAEVAEACPPTSANSVSLSQAASQLKQAAQDQLSWSSLSQQFQANLNVLNTRGGHFAALADATAQVWKEASEGLTAHKASDGNVFVRGTRSSGHRIWLPAPSDYHGALEAIPENPPWSGRMPPPFLFEGVGLGWLLPRLHASTHHTSVTFSPMIFFIEPNLRALATVLHLQNWTVPLADERVWLFAGPKAWESWTQWMCDDSKISPPQPIKQLPQWVGTPASQGEQCRQRVLQHYESLRRQYQRQADELYGDRDTAWWAKRYQAAGSNDPLRVLCLTSRFTTFLRHSTEDLARAFESLGIKTTLLMEPTPHSSFTPHFSLKACVEFEPDLVMVIDHHRHEYPGWLPSQVPFVCWIQDDLPDLFAADVGEKLGPLDFTMGYGRVRGVIEAGYPRERFMASSMAIDETKFELPAEGREDESLRCDAVFISHHSETPEDLCGRVKRMAGDERLGQLMDAFFEETRGLFASAGYNAGYNLDRLFREVEAKAGIVCENESTRQQVMTIFARPLADRILRHASLGWVADWAEGSGRTLHIYGKGWEAHPRFGRYAKGPAAHGQQLARISRAAGVNLHISSAPALHQRVLEAAAAGGFVMVRYHPADFFEPGHEAMRAFLAERDIREPTQLSLEEVPREYVAMKQRTNALIGETMTDHIQVTMSYLLQHGPLADPSRRDQYAGEVFKDLKDITFDSPEQFAERAEYFLNHPDQRQAIVDRMKTTVNDRFTYQALLSRLIEFVTARVTEQ